jgi:hypothetical protein
MLRVLFVALPVVLICLLLQAAFVTLSLRKYTNFRAAYPGASSARQMIMLSTVMLLTLVGNCIQMSIWALLFMLLGEFQEFQTALYHSGVNFVTLGYGDIVMSPRWRLLGPLEGANGILMFGVSTAVLTGLVMDVINDNLGAHKDSKPR